MLLGFLIIKFLSVALSTFYKKKQSQAQEAASQLNMEHAYGADEIFEAAKGISKERKFTESFEVIVKLNVDPTQGD